MSVTSVTAALPTPYGSVSGNTSRSAKYAAVADRLREDTAAQAEGLTGDIDSPDRSQFQSAYAEALRADGATAGRSSDETSGADSGGSQSPAGIALYKRVSLIGSNESSPSALLKSWNSIVQGGQDADSAGAATLQELLQSGASGYGSGVLDVTA